MKANKDGLIFLNATHIGTKIEPVEAEVLRDLGGTTDFTPDETKYFMHVVGTQISKTTVKTLVKKILEEEEEEDA